MTANASSSPEASTENSAVGLFSSSVNQTQGRRSSSSSSSSSSHGRSALARHTNAPLLCSLRRCGVHHAPDADRTAAAARAKNKQKLLSAAMATTSVYGCCQGDSSITFRQTSAVNHRCTRTRSGCEV
ncbi:uncharacterized protein V6R79_003085 [Siganus canaliculatus]